MGNTPSAVLMHALPCALRQSETIPERTHSDKLRGALLGKASALLVKWH